MRVTIEWTPQRVNRLRAVMAEGLSYAEVRRLLSDEWGVRLTRPMVRLACQRYSIPSRASVLGCLARHFAPYLDAWRLTGDWMIAGDLELPYIDASLAERFVESGEALGIKQALIAGDVFEFEPLGPYGAVVPRPDVKVEGELARAMMERWLEWFDDIRMLCGNHDIRMLKSLEGAVEVEDAMALLSQRLGGDPRVRWSVYGYAVIDSPSGEWRVTHPANYRKTALSTASELATNRGQNIISFHEHRTAMGIHADGQHVVVNVGCMANPDKLAYRMLRDSTHASMTQSYAVLKGGQVRLFSPHIGWWS